jgi:hypothetical protein
MSATAVGGIAVVAADNEKGREMEKRVKEQEQEE